MIRIDRVAILRDRTEKARLLSIMNKSHQCCHTIITTSNLTNACTNRNIENANQNLLKRVYKAEKSLYMLIKILHSDGDQKIKDLIRSFLITALNLSN